jgi:hypothetical protein
MGSAVVTFHGWTHLGIGGGPATQTLQTREGKASAQHSRLIAATPQAPGTPIVPGTSVMSAALAADLATTGQSHGAPVAGRVSSQPRRAAGGRGGSHASRVSHHGPTPAPVTTTSPSPATPTTTTTPTASAPAPTPAVATTTSTTTSPVTVTVPVRAHGHPHPARAVGEVSHPVHTPPGHDPSHQTPESAVKRGSTVVSTPDPASGPPVTDPGHPTHPVHPVPGHGGHPGPAGHPAPGHVGQPGPPPAPAVPGPGPSVGPAGDPGHPGHGFGFGHNH